ACWGSAPLAASDRLPLPSSGRADAQPGRRLEGSVTARPERAAPIVSSSLVLGEHHVEQLGAQVLNMSSGIGDRLSVVEFACPPPVLQPGLQFGDGPLSILDASVRARHGFACLVGVGQDTLDGCLSLVRITGTERFSCHIDVAARYLHIEFRLLVASAVGSR